jgi:hypothetical protein
VRERGSRAGDDAGGTASHERQPPAAAAEDGDLAATVAQLSTPALVPAQRRRLVHRLTRQAATAMPRWRTGAVRLWRPGTAVRWVSDALGEVAPHVPVRDLATLHRHYGEVDADALAHRLVRNAARATAGVGAASGGLAAVKWTVPPTLLAAPVLLAAETLAVVAIEVKLVGELHAAYQRPIEDAGAQRAVSLLRSWAAQRGINVMPPSFGAATVLGTAARKELADRLARRFGRNLSTLAPLLAGAAVASYLNQRATSALGKRLRADLSGHLLPAAAPRSA